MKRTDQIALIAPFLKSVQSQNISAVNEALNEIYLENEDGEAFIIRYFIDHTCERYWEASYTIYKDCPITNSGISISEGWARAKYCYIEDSE
jgi:hypothetical protein